MSTYAVLWQSNHAPPQSGRLEFDRNRLYLHGGDRRHEVEVAIPYTDIVAAERDPQAHIGPCRAIRLKPRGTGPILLASLTGVGALTEILTTLLEALSPPNRATRAH